MFVRVATVALCVLGLAQANRFASRLFSSIAKNEKINNIVISPSIIHASLALLYIGSEGEAASELKGNLQLRGNSKNQDLEEFKQLPTQILTDSIQLYTVYKLYVDNKFKLRDTFQHPALTYLRTLAQHVNFSFNHPSSSIINHFIEARTKHQFRDIVQISEFDVTTHAFLVQGFYFTGQFEKPFRQIKNKTKFFYTPTESISHIPSYSITDELKSGFLPEIMCKGVEIPYKNSNLSMLILMPHIRTQNLKPHEKLLKKFDIRSLTANFKRTHIKVQMPGSRIQYEIELSEALKSLGMNTMYDRPEFTVLSDTPGLQISKIKHKGVIDIDPGLTDCEACIEPDRDDDVAEQFIVDHPYFFVIKDDSRTYLLGRVLKPYYKRAA